MNRLKEYATRFVMIALGAVVLWLTVAHAVELYGPYESVRGTVQEVGTSGRKTRTAYVKLSGRQAVFYIHAPFFGAGATKIYDSINPGEGIEIFIPAADKKKLAEKRKAADSDWFRDALQSAMKSMPEPFSKITLPPFHDPGPSISVAGIRGSKLLPHPDSLNRMRLEFVPAGLLFGGIGAFFLWMGLLGKSEAFQEALQKSGIPQRKTPKPGGKGGSLEDGAGDLARTLERSGLGMEGQKLRSILQRGCATEELRGFLTGLEGTYGAALDASIRKKASALARLCHTL